MATQFHVNGEASIWIQIPAGSLTLLGVSTADGVNIDVTEHTEEIFTDTFGPSVPFDEQQMLEDAVIRAKLVWYDESVLVTIRGRAGASEGAMPAAGTLWGQSTHYFRTLIKSPIDALPWNFPSSRLRGALPFNRGVRRSEWGMEIYAIPYTGTQNSSAGAVLYNHVGT